MKTIARVSWFMVGTAGAQAAGLAMAMLLLPDLQTTSSGSGQVHAFLVLTVILTAASPLREALTFSLLDASMREDSAAAMARSLDQVYLGVPPANTRLARRRGTVLGGFVFLFASLVAVLWAAVWLTELMGLPMRTPGGWQTAIAALVVLAVQDVLGRLRDLFDEHERMRAVLRIWLFGSCWLGLWFVTMLPNAELVSQSSSPAALTLAGYAAMFALTVTSREFGGLDVPVRVPLWAPLPLVLNGMRLWGLSWLSEEMSQPLEISGFWTFVVGAVIIRLMSSLSDSAHGAPEHRRVGGMPRPFDVG